ncbi:MAG: hypothetical protein PUD15_08435 [Prevotella sp.]|nr:hypothetical protein [Prevotella sp.]
MLSRNTKLGFWSDRLFKIYWLALVVLMFHILDTFAPASYTDWGISDWMINYQGGFVRRGLDGQLLYWLYQIHPYDFTIMVKRIVVFSSLILIGITMKTFSKEGWSMTILIFGCCFFFIAFKLWQRRDSMILILVYLIFISFKHYLNHQGKGWLLLFWALSAFMLLSHEASFFFCFPIMMVYAIVLKMKEKNTCLLKSLWSAWGPFIPCFLIMGFVCLFKGNENTASTIWHSWHQLFVQYPDPKLSVEQVEKNIGAGVSALSWQTLWTFKYHLSLNFFGNPNGLTSLKDLTVTPLLIWMIIATYILVTRINTVNISLYPLTKEDQTNRISNVLLVQFIFMLPLFTVLSCDWGRTLPYWIISSLFALHVFGDLKIAGVSRCSDKILSRLNRIIHPTAFAYLITAVFIPFVNCYGPYPGKILPIRFIEIIVHRLL